MNPPIRMRSLLLLLLLSWSASVASQGREPAHPYGRDFRFLESPTAAASLDPVAGADSDATPDPAQRRAAVKALRDLLEQLEWRDGPYGSSLTEPLTDLARQLDSLGQYAEAQSLRERALHLLRVNGGLYSPAQAPVLRELLEGDRRAGDYEALDRRYDYFFRLWGSGRPPYTQERLASTLEYLDWQREALLLGLDGDSTLRLLALYETGESLFEALLAEESAPWELLRDAGLSQLRTLYLVSHRMRFETETQPTLLSPRVPRVDRDFSDFDPQRDRLLKIGRRLRALEDDLLGALLERAPDRLAKAAVLRERGDWEAWHKREASALAWYQESWKMLEDAGEPLLQERWYGAPVPLPANGAFEAGPGRRGVLLFADLAIDEGGRVDAEVVRERADAGRERLQLLRWLRYTRFRPALDSRGEPRKSTLGEIPTLVY